LCKPPNRVSTEEVFMLINKDEIIAVRLNSNKKGPVLGSGLIICKK